MSQVVSLDGQPIERDKPFDEVVERLEELLQRAKNGEIRSFAYSVSNSRHDITTGWAGEHGTSHMVMAGICLLQHRYVEALSGNN